MRIVFMGTPEFAVPSLEALLRSDYQVVGVVSQPDRPKGRPFETESMAEDFRNSLIFDEDGESVPVVPIDFGDVWCDVDAEEIKVMHSDFE